MADAKKLSRTMRIDLIPDVPVESEPGRLKKVVIASTARAPRTETQPRPSSAGDSLYDALLQSVYDAALITDLGGNVVDANARAVAFLRHSREELCGLTIFDVISGADETLIQTIWDHLEGERFALIQAYCVRKDSSYFPAEIAVNKLRLGRVHLCFFVRDITVRRQAEEMLRTEHNAIQNAGTGIAVADVGGQMEYANPAVARTWAYADTDPLLGRNVRDLFADGGGADEMVRAVVEGQRGWSGELKGRKLDGTEFDCQVSAACNRNSDGEVVGVVLSLVDVSDRKRAEEAIREAERHRVMIESLGAACHHLGQPATVLLANLSVMQQKVDTTDKTVRDLVRMSIEAAEALGEILHKLNAVNEYRTTLYLSASDASSEESRIIEI